MSANAQGCEFVPRPMTEDGGGRRQGKHGRGRGGSRSRHARKPEDVSKSKVSVPSPIPSSPNTVINAAKGDVKSDDAVDDGDEEEEVCFICAEPVHFSAITACNHRTCHICALRLRALYRNYACAYCKTESKEVLFTLPSTKDFDEYKKEDIVCKDEKLGISFELPAIMEETMILLRYNCPVNTCDVAADGWKDLKRHIKEAHNQLLCDLCVKNKKIFVHEHELFSAKGLTSHYKFGNRDVQDDNGFKGHPECGFCSQAFYDDDELYKHCRDKHERCHVCDQVENGPGRAQYFQDYKQLDQHFRRDHFVCPEPSCLEQKFVVFGSELDLKAHQLEAHPNGLSGQALRDARKVNTSFAGYQGPANARGNRGGRRPEFNFQSTPSTTGPLSREQQALQRQFEYQRSRAQMTGFGYALSEPDPPPPQPAMQVPKPSPVVQQEPQVEAFPALGGSVVGAGPTMGKTKKNRSQKTNNQQQPAASQASNGEVSKHQALLEKIQVMTSYDEEKVAVFKTNIAQYRSTNIMARDLLDNLWALLKVKVDALGSVVTSAADLLDSEAKKNELLAAWNDWKIMYWHENPAPTSALPSIASSGGGQRILNIKNRASRTASQTSSVWNQASASSARGKDPIASTASRLSALQVSGGRGGSSYTPAWSASAANSKPGSGASTPVRTANNGNAAAPMDFPSLPMGSKARVNTNQYFQKNGGWGASAGPVVGPEDYEVEGEEANPAVIAKGKKKPKKQLLFSQGLQRG